MATPCLEGLYKMTIEIFKPLMQANTGIRKVSLAVHKVMQEGDVVKVQIVYQRKDKTLLHANPFLISKEKALKFPKITIKGVTCVTIPLHEFKEDIPKAEPPIIIKIEQRNLGDILTRPCWNCKGTKFWKTRWGEWMCSREHPNPNPEVNTEVIDIAEKDKRSK